LSPSGIIARHGSAAETRKTRNKHGIPCFGCGIFLPLSNLADGGLTFTLELDVTSEEGIPPRVLEQTLKETVRQIGARVVEEEKG
jgi:hypothetical protein